MQSNTRTRILMTAAAIMTAPIVAMATPAFASGGGGGHGVTNSGACTNGGHFKLKAKHDDGRIQLEYEVDSNRAGQVWTVVLKDNGVTVFSGSRTTQAPSGSFTVARRIPNRAGLDNVVASAKNAKTGESCVAKASI